MGLIYQKWSGKEGRITRKDLLSLIESKTAPIEAKVEKSVHSTGGEN